MSGNTWDWTSSLYHSYPYDGSDGREFAHSGNDRRVVRGGSWGVNWVNARAAYRLRARPAARDLNLGFRLVCSSPIL